MRHLLAAVVATLSCIAFISASAQTPRITSPAARAAIVHPHAIAPPARAALASRLTGETITAAEITDTVSVSVLQPVVGDPRAPTLSLELRRGHWITTGSDPHADILGTETLLDLRFSTAANVRYLVICEMSGRVQLQPLFDQPSVVITWETPTRGAMLVPPRPEAGRFLIRFTGGGELRSCEVSRLG